VVGVATLRRLPDPAAAPACVAAIRISPRMPEVLDELAAAGGRPMDPLPTLQRCERQRPDGDRRCETAEGRDGNIR
jgi:hypothetical protein